MSISALSRQLKQVIEISAVDCIVIKALEIQVYLFIFQRERETAQGGEGQRDSTRWRGTERETQPHNGTC